MAAKVSKKRKIDEASVDDFETKGSRWANQPRAGAPEVSSALDELAALESSIDRLHRGLDAARDVLWASQYESELDAKALSSIVDYAHRTCYIAAPHGFVPGESQLFMMRPPAPQTMQFQQSILHQLAASAAGKALELYTTEGTVGAGNEAGDVAGDSADATRSKPENNRGTGTRPGEAAGAASNQRASDPVADKVDMVEMLKGMPEMPVGWKPGDPIPGAAVPTRADATGGAEKGLAIARSTDAAKPERSPAQPTKKPSGLALGLEVDDLDFGLGSSSSDEDDD